MMYALLSASGRRGHAPARLLLALLLAGACTAAAALEPMLDELLGSARIACDKGVRIHGKPSLYYPPGKAEWVSVPVASDLVPYDCGLLRGRVLCAVYTSRIEVRRLLGRGQLEVRCYGNPPLRSVLVDDGSEDGAREGTAEGGESTAQGAAEGAPGGEGAAAAVSTAPARLGGAPGTAGAGAPGRLGGAPGTPGSGAPGRLGGGTAAGTP